MSTQIKYKGRVVVAFESGTAILRTNGDKLESDLEIMSTGDGIPVPVWDEHDFTLSDDTELQPVLAAGLYDAEDNLVASWDTLVNTYGMDCETNYTSSNYNTVTTSPYYVLSNNAELASGTKLIISDSVTSIGDYAFYKCSSITSIELTSIELTSIEIPDSVTSIGKKAFFGCISLTSVTIGNSVTSIGWCAFENCTGLTSIVIPDSVTSIGEEAFSYCDSLTSITVEEGNSKYHSAGNCLIETESKALILGCQNSIIPSDGSVTSIGDNAFYRCTSLASIEIPDSVMSIGEGAFLGCTSLTSIETPNSLTSIGKDAFFGCDNLTSIEIPNSVTSIGGYAFSDCYSLKSVVIPNSITSISFYTFAGCSSLTSIEIPDSVTSIGWYAFSGCTALTSIEIPNRVISIDEGTFRYCTSLTSIEIPNSVTSIGKQAFYECSSLVSITIGNSVKSIGEAVILGSPKLVEVINHSSLNITAGSNDYGNIGVNALEIHTGESKIVNKDDFLFYTYNGVNYLLGYKGTDTDLVLPSDYNGEKYEIYKYAFSNCTSLTSIEIPNSVTSIGNRAFYKCSSLKSIVIPDGVISIGSLAFFGCTSLTTVCCEATSQPIGWDSSWLNGCNATVVWGWGYTGG